MRTTTVHLKEARGNGGTGWNGAKGENWDNCNSIINKIYIFKRSIPHKADIYL